MHKDTMKAWDKINEQKSKIKPILVKVSGDLVGDDRALDFLWHVGDIYSEELLIAVIVGGRTQINKALEAQGYKVQFNEHNRRKHPDWKSNRIAAEVLMAIAHRLERRLWTRPEEDVKNQMKDYYTIVPFLGVRHMGAHMDADDMLRMMYHNFDKAYCLTKKGRKKDFPPSIEIVYFD